MDTETLAVYGLQALLWFLALARMGAKPCVVVLGLNLALSWVIGEFFTGADRRLAMMLLDYFTILRLLELHPSPRRKLIATIALTMITWRIAAYVIEPYTGHYVYAVAINCAVITQLLIAGGWIDEWGRRINNRLDHLHPSLARALRYVAT
jgi:hypothetical protein